MHDSVRDASKRLPRVIMVRHGESEWNVLGKWQGRADTRLTESGRRQAREAAQAVVSGNFGVSRIIASSLSRASETATIIAQQLGLPTPTIDDRLVETDVGPWEGLQEHEIEAAWPNYLGERRIPPNFEPPHEVFERATLALRDAHSVGDAVLVVSHSGVIRTIRRMMEVHDRRLHNLEGCYFHLDERGELVAGDFVSLAATTRPVVSDAV